MNREVRQPAVAGRFYSADAERLRDDVARYLDAGGAEPIRAQAVMSPHAGYIYSGAIAGETFARVVVPGRAVVLNPNHTGRGSRRAVWSAGAWSLPGDRVPIDEKLADAIRREAKLDDDQLAHRGEHSGEVQLPFLRARRSDVAVVPVCLGHLTAAECRSVGEGLARAIRTVADDPRDVLIVASTDMSHFISADAARELDQMALDRVLAFDPEGLYEVVVRNDISMCGFIPTTVALVAARELGANVAQLVRYGNSGEASGDWSRVVGYAGAILA